MAWYPFFGKVIFWIGLILSIIIFSIKKKWYPVMYFVSLSLYIFTAGFIIDVFDFSKNKILLVLAFSSFVMLALGVYLSKKIKEPEKKPKEKLKK